MSKKINVGDLYQERTEGVKYKRFIHIRKVEKIGSEDYVYFMADNAAAKAIHPNGGFVPLDGFIMAWEPKE